MKTEISFYELDLLSKIGVAGGWIAFVLFVLGLTAWLFFKVVF